MSSTGYTPPPKTETGPFMFV